MESNTVDLNNALIDAVKVDDTTQVIELLKQGADPNFIVNNGFNKTTPLIIATKNGFIELIKILVDAHADIDKSISAYMDCEKIVYRNIDGLLHLKNTSLLLDFKQNFDLPKKQKELDNMIDQREKEIEKLKHDNLKLELRIEILTEVLYRPGMPGCLAAQAEFESNIR